MPFVTSHRTRIHYEVEGEGPPLVLHHGLACSLETWRDHGYTTAFKSSPARDLGYTDAEFPAGVPGTGPVGSFGQSYRLILIDARGHGASEKSNRPEAYHVDTLAADVLAVLDDLRIAKAHFWGYSLGALVGFALAARVPSRFASFILGGYSPYGVRSETERNYTEMVARAAATAVETGIGAYVAALERASGPLPEQARSRILANDPRALLALARTVYRWPGVGQVLPLLAVPCLLYAGETDVWRASAEEGARELKQAAFVVLPAQDHFTAPYHGELILPHALRFLAQVADA